MCSVQEDDSDTPLRKEKTCSGKLCMKCKEEKAVLITRVNDAFCRACFLTYVTHKFRAAIGKSKLIRDGEHVLIGYSGGPSSSCLIHLIQEGLSGRAHKKLRFQPALLFVDEGAVTGMSKEERNAAQVKVLNIMEKSGYEFYIRSLEQVMALEKFDQQSHEDPTINNTAINPSRVPDLHSNCESPPDDEAVEKLKSLLNSLTSISAKEEMIRNLRQCLLVDVAKRHNYSKIMLGDTGTRLSVRLLSDIAQGRGAHVSMETAFADRRNKDLLTVRPIRDFSSKEVAMYNSLCNVESVFIPTLTTMAAENSSIEHLTEEFVTGLQAEYPSTVSNIIRTGEKLSTEENKEQCCAICQAPLDTDVGASSALSAVEFSLKVSRKRSETPLEKEDTTCCGEGDGSCQSHAESVTREDVLYALCYGCRKIVHDLSDVSKLPEFLLKDISLRMRRAKMKNDIQEFLL